jgi:hypothetical protein
MSDDNDNKSQVSTNASEESLRKPRIPDPFAKLTDEDWRHAMIRGREYSDAKDAAIGAGIRRGCEKSIIEAHEALDKTQAALRTYLEGADPINILIPIALPGPSSTKNGFASRIKTGLPLELSYVVTMLVPRLVPVEHHKPAGYTRARTPVRLRSDIGLVTFFAQISHHF